MAGNAGPLQGGWREHCLLSYKHLTGVAHDVWPAREFKRKNIPLAPVKGHGLKFGEMMQWHHMT